MNFKIQLTLYSSITIFIGSKFRTVTHVHRNVAISSSHPCNFVILPFRNTRSLIYYGYLKFHMILTRINNFDIDTTTYVVVTYVT